MSQPWEEGSGGTQPPFTTFQAIWDTGATNSVITQPVVDACGLVPTGMARVSHVNGEDDAEVYLVNIALPNNVVFSGVRVTKGAALKGADMLIGMDIISRGDFAVTNQNGKTTFSFRIPSSATIDFTTEINADNARHARMQAPRRTNLNVRRKNKKGRRR